MRTGMNEAWQVFRQSAGWFGRHSPAVAAFGLLASVQRFTAVCSGKQSSWASGAPGELFAAASRVGFLAWCIRRVFDGSPAPARDVPRRLVRYGREHAGAVEAGGLLFGALIVVFKLVPDAVIARMDEDSRKRASAWELAIKNVTIIPFTIVWIVIGARHAIEAGRPTIRK